MATVTIGAVMYDVYADVADADLYLAADFSRAAPWDALSTDEKGQALVTSTRRFDRLQWLGTITDILTPQPLEFPRDGLVDCDDVALPDGTTPQDVIDASILFAADIAVTPSLDDDSSTSSNIKRVVAGSVEVEFFRASGGVILPKSVFEMVSCFLSGNAVVLAEATGVDAVSTTEQDTFCRTQGFA